MENVALKGAKLVFFLILLPAFLTRAHLYFTLQRHGILLVESLPVIGSIAPEVSLTASSISLSGLYWSMAPESRNGGATYIRQNEASHRRKLFGLLPAWPSISQIAASLVGFSLDPNQPRFKLEYEMKYQAYCFSTPEYSLCPQAAESSKGQQQTQGKDRFFPPDFSEWKIITENSKSVKTPSIIGGERSIRLRIRSFSWFKSYYFQKEEKPFQQLFQRPATCLLLGLNVGLAFLYWNFRINANTVALMDGPILQQFQYWRGITGTLAHFEWWHLLFNMMSLHNLGSFLEDRIYGSIAFLLLNLGLIPVTVLIFFGGSHLFYWGRLKLRQSTNTASTTALSRPTINAVGYSGVLFAWMVIASLEQPKSCPIPFLDNVCFETWHITKHIKFNIGPLIQLVIASAILPRVSFGGHLAGIIAGFWLHWSLLPLELIQPVVIIPLIILAQWKLRHYIPIHDSKPSNGHILNSTSPRNFLDEAGIDEEEDQPRCSLEDSKVAVHNTTRLLRVPCLLLHNNSASMGMRHLLSTLLLAMISLLGLSVFVMSWSSGILYAQILNVALFYNCYQSYNEHGNQEGEQDQWSLEGTQMKHRMLVLSKGYIVGNILIIIMESMTLASWVLMGPAMFPRFSCWVPLSLIVGLISTHLAALTVACKLWDDAGGGNEEKGIFEYTLGYCVLHNANGVGLNLLACWTSNSSSCQCRRDSAYGSQNNNGPERGSSLTLGGAVGDKKAMAAAAAERRARASSAVQESDGII